MADTKISAESSAGALDGSEIVPVVRGSGSPPTYSNLRTTAQDIADLAPVADSAALDAAFGSTRGAVLYRGAAAWAKLDPGTSGHFLKTLGAGADPAWASAAGASVDSAALDAAFGSTRGSILRRGASGWEILTPGTSGDVLTSQGAGADPAWAAGGGGGGGSGLYAPAMSAVPTAANTGLSTWANQGAASVADSAVGVAITAPANSGDSLRVRSKTAPATPYTVRALIAVVNKPAGFHFCGIGWSDGTKYHVFMLRTPAGTASVSKWNTVSSFSADDTAITNPQMPIGPGRLWVELQDDGTTVTFKTSADGENFVTIFSVARASGFLGASGYSNVLFFVNTNDASNPTIGTLMSYEEA